MLPIYHNNTAIRSIVIFLGFATDFASLLVRPLLFFSARARVAFLVSPNSSYLFRHLVVLLKHSACQLCYNVVSSFQQRLNLWTKSFYHDRSKLIINGHDFECDLVGYIKSKSVLKYLGRRLRISKPAKASASAASVPALRYLQSESGALAWRWVVKLLSGYRLPRHQKVTSRRIQVICQPKFTL